MCFLPSKKEDKEQKVSRYSINDNSLVNIFNIIGEYNFEKELNMNLKNQSFGTVNGSVNNIENGNAYNTINVNSTETDKIMTLLKDFKELILSESELSDENKEDILDDVEVISEQITASEPKVSRVRNAVKRLGNIITTLPASMQFTEKIITQGNSLLDTIKNIFDL